MTVEQSGASSLTFLAAARRVLAESGQPLHPRDIVARALQIGLVQTKGRTPEATMAAQLYTDIQRRGEQSPFVRVGRGRFGLREWGITATMPERASSPRRVRPTSNVIPLAQDEAERIAAEILTAQYDSSNATHFEQVLAKAFAFLGFRATHVGGSGRADIVLRAAVSAGPYSAVIEAKSNRAGRLADASIDWNSLADHRAACGADHAVVVAPGFGGGNLLKRADDYGVVLLTSSALADLVRLHRDAPFSLVDLRVLFETPGLATKAVEHLSSIARSTLGRWRLIGDLVTLIEQLPPGVDVDAQKLWLLLSFQQKENAPSRDAVEDAVSILASKAVGVLQSCNGGGEYQMTMQAETAIRRLRALARASGGENMVAYGVQGTPVKLQASSPKRPPAVAAPPEPSGSVDFSSPRAGLLQRLQTLGFGPPQEISGRHVRLTKGPKTVGLAFRGSKRYSDGKWWWTFTEAADRAPLADCDAIVLVGLMQDPSDPARAREEVLFLPWRDAVEAAKATEAWARAGRLHVWIQPPSTRWSGWVISPRDVSSGTIEALFRNAAE